jgi:hypothetical protein
MEVAFYTCENLESRRWNFAFDWVMFQEQKIMSDYSVWYFRDENTKIIWFDKLHQYVDIPSWELAAIEEQEAETYIWNLVSHGEMPDEAMEKNFEVIMLMIMPMTMKMVWWRWSWHV